MINFYMHVYSLGVNFTTQQEALTEEQGYAIMERNVLLEVRVSEHCFRTVCVTLSNFAVLEHHRRHRLVSHFYFQYPLSRGLSVNCAT